MQEVFIVKKIVISVIVLFLFLWILWLVAVPESLIADQIKRSTEGRGIGIELTALEKGYFFTLHAERAIISKHPSQGNPQPAGDRKQATDFPGGLGDEAPLLVVGNLDIAPDLLSFLKLAPRFDFSGQVGQGKVHGVLTGVRQGADVTMRGSDINVGSLPVFARAGINGEGILAFDFRWRDSQGAITFSIDKAKLTGGLAGFNAVPLNYFKKAKGLLTLRDRITVDSFTMEGPGVYVRAKGEIRGSTIAGRAEIMVDASFEQYSLLQAVLEQYKVSPGYYVVPISQSDLISNSHFPR